MVSIIVEYSNSHTTEIIVSFYANVINWNLGMRNGIVLNGCTELEIIVLMKTGR